MTVNPQKDRKDSGQLPYPYGNSSSDQEAEAEVMNALHHNSGVPQDRLRVEVRGGHAALSGEVEKEYERELAEQTIATLPGVVEVTNEIKVEEESAPSGVKPAGSAPSPRR